MNTLKDIHIENATEEVLTNLGLSLVTSRKNETFESDSLFINGFD